jgi:hypothetical protein
MNENTKLEMKRRKIRKKKNFIILVFWVIIGIAAAEWIIPFFITQYYENFGYYEADSKDDNVIENDNIIKNVDLSQIKTIAEQSSNKLKRAAKNKKQPVHIYLHWSAGHYGQFFNSYHINIDYDGEIYVSTEDFSQLKKHTWRRNYGSVGVTMACAYKAAPDNLGNEPPTDAQIETMAQVVAVLAKVFNIPLNKAYIMTHAEAAAIDGYDLGSGDPDTRWDLLFLKNGDPAGSGGQKIRELAVFYQKSGKLNALFK